MKTQRLFIALAVLNLALLVFLLAQIEVRFLGFRFLPRSVEVNSVGSVLRGRALEITDGKNSGKHQGAPSRSNPSIPGNRDTSVD